MGDFLYVLNQLLKDFIKKSPNKSFAKKAIQFYIMFKMYNNNIIARYNTSYDLYNALINKGIKSIKYDGCNCYLPPRVRQSNTKKIVRGVLDITNFLVQGWHPTIRDQIYDDLRLYIKLGGVIMYQGKLITTRELLYQTNQKIKLTYYPKNKYIIKKTTHVRFKI